MTRQILAAIAVIIASLTVTLASAQVTITSEINDSGKANIAALYSANNAFVFAQQCEGGWWQAYAGATYSDNIGEVAYQLGLGLGTEKFGSRYGGWVWMGEGNFSFIHLFEGAGSGPWHRTIVKYQVGDKLALGLTDRAFYGRGVRAEYKLDRTFTLIGEAFEGGKSTLALSTSF